MENKEMRTITTKLETRFEDDGVGKLVGYAAIFDSPTDIRGLFTEKIVRGAFKSSLDNDIKALWNHDSSYPVGSTGSGTLKLTEDEYGLRFDLTPINTTAGRDLLESVKSGVVNGMSFGFLVRKDSWDGNIRSLEDVELFEISACPFPAYKDTTIVARSVEKMLQEKSAIPEDDSVKIYLLQLRKKLLNY